MLKIAREYRLNLLLISLASVILLYSFQFFLDADQFSWIDISLFVIIPLLAVFASVALLLTLRKNKQNTKPILFLTAGLVFWFIAEQIWLTFEYFLNIDPFPSIADFFYLGGYPLITIFLILSLSPFRKDITKNMWIFSITISTVFLIPVFLTLQDIDQSDSILADIVVLLYPIVDEVLLIPAMLAILLFYKNHHYFFFFVLLAIIATLVGDLVFFMAILTEQYYEGHPANIIYLCSYLLFIFSLYGYNQEQKKGKLSFHQTITDSNYELITKIIIPLTVGAIIVITSLSLAYLNFIVEFNEEQSKVIFSLSLGIAALVGVFVTIFITIGKNLAKLIEMKTREIQRHKDQLESQLQKLKKFDVAKGEFISMVTHELKTTIVPIKSYTDLLISEQFGPLTNQQKEKLEIIQSSASTLRKMMTDLIDIQKFELGVLKLNKNMHNLSLIIKNIIKKLEPDIINREISIETILDEKLTCFCDKDRIEQVLTNLIINSLKFCEKKRGEIVVSLKQENDFIKIIVQDNGIGLDKESLKNIFAMFYQVDKTLTRSSGGTGLGLAICKIIIENHNGEIWAESEGIGKGTEIHIRLPLS